MRQGAEQDVTGNAGGRLLLTGNLEGHGSVDAHQACSGYNVEQDGDVAVTDQPFRMLLILFLRDAVQQVDGTIAATRADDGLDTIILECPEQVGSAFVGCSCVGVYI